MITRRNALLLFLLLLAVTACDSGPDDPPIFYLHAGEGGAQQIYRLDPGAVTARQITGRDDPHAPEVIDFAVAPDGRRIAYTTLAGNGGSSIHLIDIGGGNDESLITCPQAECSGSVWSPDGRRLLYESRSSEKGRVGEPRQRWLDPASGETLPLIAGDGAIGYGARFSPDGAWLSYVSPANAGVVLYRLADGRQRLLSSRVGSPAVWSPDSTAVVYGDLVVQGHETAPEMPGGEGELSRELPVQESSNTFLYRSVVDDEGARERLSPDAAVADTAAAFSPDGEWIAFGRAPANTAAGRQIWLMRADGSEARPLTSDPAVTHGPPSWSPDGRYLLFQRYSPAEGTTSVWRLAVATGAETLVAADGYLPSWGR